MTDRSEAKAFFSRSLQEGSLRGRAAIWRLKGPEVQWVVHLDDLPYGNRFGIDIGLDLQSITTPRLPTDCPVLIRLETLPISQEFLVVEASDLDSGLAPHRRREELEGAARALADYIEKHLTLNAVRAAFRDGDFDAAFIRKDARAVLEAGERIFIADSSSGKSPRRPAGHPDPMGVLRLDIEGSPSQVGVGIEEIKAAVAALAQGQGEFMIVTQEEAERVFAQTHTDGNPHGEWLFEHFVDGHGYQREAGRDQIVGLFEEWIDQGPGWGEGDEWEYLGDFS